MAAEDRRATRREPITVTVETTKGKTVQFVAKPIPWRKRNDLGDALISMYAVGLNGMATEMRDADGNLVGLESHLFESGLDYETLFSLGYAEYDVNDAGEIVAQEIPSALMGSFRMLDFDAQVEVCEAALTANSLERLSHLLDPDRKKDLMIGESVEPLIEDGSKTELLTDSGLLSPAGQDQE